MGIGKEQDGREGWRGKGVGKKRNGEEGGCGGEGIRRKRMGREGRGWEERGDGWKG